MMKLNILIVLFLAHQVWCRANMKQIYCNSNGPVFINPFCKLRPLSRTAETISIGSETTKLLDEVFVSLEISTKMSSYSNSLIKIPPVNFCEFFKMQNKTGTLSMIQESYRVYQLSFPSLPQSCPVMPGKYREVNRTLEVLDSMKLPNNPIMKQFTFPNGRYKFDILASEKDTSSYFRWGFIIEVHNRLGEDKI